jgi:hypothetical protein
MLEPGFLTPKKWRLGLTGVGLIILAIAIFSWLRRDIFTWKRSEIKRADKPGELYLSRKETKFKGLFLLAVFAIIIISILYYAYR